MSTPKPEPVIARGEPIPKGGGRYLIGQPYWMLGQWFTPAHDPSYDRVGIASYLSPEWHGTRSSNGEILDEDALQAAHPTWPLPSHVEVENLANGCTLVIRINDRGPFVPGRILDMTRRAAQLLGFESQGLAQVRVRYLGPAPLNGDDTWEREHLRRFPGLGCRAPVDQRRHWARRPADGVMDFTLPLRPPTMRLE